MVCNCIDYDSVDVAVVFLSVGGMIMTVVVLSNGDGVVVIW